MTDSANKMLPRDGPTRFMSGSYAPVILLWILVAGFDIYERFIPDFGPQGGSSRETRSSRLASPQLLSDAALEFRTARLADFGLDALAAAPPIQEEVEASFVDAWSTAEYSFRLVAVIKSAETFAVITRKLNVGGETEVLRVQEGEIVEGFSVDEISSHRLLVRNDEGIEINLVLFEPSAPAGSDLSTRVESYEK